MNSKARLALCSLNDKEVVRLIDTFTNDMHIHLNKETHQISFNCYQSTVHWTNHHLGGYGKTASEAQTNCLRKLIDIFANSQTYREQFSYALKRTRIEDNDLKRMTTQEQQMSKLHLSDMDTKKIRMDDSKKLNSNGIQTKNNFKRLQLRKNEYLRHQYPKPQYIRHQLTKNECTIPDDSFLNLENVQISNPNSFNKVCPHERYMSQSSQSDCLATLKRQILELQARLAQANLQQQGLKEQLAPKQRILTEKNEFPMQSLKNIESNCMSIKNIEASCASIKPARKKQMKLSVKLPTEPNEDKHRSSSVHTGKVSMVKVPKLQLDKLPSYHGRSNKSLNQSLLEAYEKGHK